MGQVIGRRVVFSDAVRVLGVIHFAGYQIYLGWEFLVRDFGRPEWELRIGCAESCSGSGAPLAKIACAFAASLLYSVDVSAWRYTLGVHYKDRNANWAPLDIVPNLRPDPCAVELPRGGMVCVFSFPGPGYASRNFRFAEIELPSLAFFTRAGGVGFCYNFQMEYIIGYCLRFDGVS